MIRMHLGGNEMHKTDTLFVGWMAFVWLESWGEKEKLCFLFSIHHFHALLANISWVLRDIVNKLIWKFSNLYNVNYSYHHGWCLQHSIFYQLKHFIPVCVIQTEEWFSCSSLSPHFVHSELSSYRCKNHSHCGPKNNLVNFKHLRERKKATNLCSESILHVPWAWEWPTLDTYEMMHFDSCWLSLTTRFLYSTFKFWKK